MNYNINNKEILTVSKLKHANFYLPYRIYNKAVNKKILKDRLGVSIVNKYKKIGGHIEHKNVRYYDIEKSIHAVTDIDEDYFKCINGRPLNIYTPIFKSLKMILNKRLHIEYDIGIRKDFILNIETNYANEIEYYNKSVTRLANQAKYFDCFILQDYKNSMFLLSQCEKLTAQVERKTKELEKIGIELFNVKSKLIGLDYKYRVQQKYGRYLYYLAPPSWRANNRKFAHSLEIEAKGFDLGKLNEEDTFAEIFDELRSICFGTPIKPVLYFKQPSDMIEVFKAMEKQQLYYFAYINHLEPQTKELKDNIRVIKNKITKDSSLVTRLIKYFKDLLAFTEKRCTQLEKLFLRVLYGEFYKMTGTPDVLKLRINLEFCYERIFLEKPANMDLLSVSKTLEKYFLNYSKRLDAIQSNSVRRAMVSYAKSEHAKYKNAETAFRELRLFNRLECRLLRAHGFLPHVNNISISQPLTNGTKKISRGIKIKKNYVLNAAELEYLTLFTDWCENENPEPYLEGVNLNVI